VLIVRAEVLNLEIAKALDAEGWEAKRNIIEMIM
jgi:hypothetical protein